MKTINVDLSSGEALNLLVGRQGESGVTQVVFDFSALNTEFGTGTVSLSVKRPKESTPYAQTITTSGTDATWTVNETDTGVAGCGEIQLTYTVNSQIAKTVVYKYTVYPSIGVDGEYPIPGQTWQEEMEDEIAEIKEDLQELQEEIEGGGGGSGMSAEFKQALHNILEKVAYIDDDGQDYLNALDSAMYPPVTAISLNTNSLSFASLNSTQQLTATTTPSGGAVTWSSSNTSIATVSSSGLVTSKGYGSATITATSGSVSAACSVAVTQATLSSISAVYTQSGTVYDTDSLDSLKTDLVVTAHWSNSTTTTVPSTDYTLSGTLTVGTSTITVSYGGKTTTFNVTVSVDTALAIFQGYTNSFTEGNYPTPFKAATNTGRTIVAKGTGQHDLLLVTTSAHTGIYPRPIPSGTSSITVTSSARFEIDILKYENDAWYVYHADWWKNSGTTIDVTSYNSGDYFFSLVIQTGSGVTTDNTAIVLA